MVPAFFTGSVSHPRELTPVTLPLSLSVCPFPVCRLPPCPVQDPQSNLEEAGCRPSPLSDGMALSSFLLNDFYDVLFFPPKQAP